MTEDRDSDDAVRVAVYRLFLDLGRAPVPAEVARSLGQSPSAVEEALHRLAAAHALVLAPGTPYIWMANPLSALPTPFHIDAGGRTWFANCIWDAFGVAGMLGSDADVRTWCPDCGDDLSLAIRDKAVAGEGVVHFAVPARYWWDDIGFT